jgi:hypothetical protein
MHFDFRTIANNERSFVRVPPGTYLCRIAEVREGLARNGSVRWSVRLEIVEGEHEGYTAAWDSLTWSGTGIHRVKRVLDVLGFDVAGELDIEPTDLLDKRARVSVIEDSREDPFTGQTILRLSVPYQGWSKP